VPKGYQRTGEITTSPCDFCGDPVPFERCQTTGGPFTTTIAAKDDGSGSDHMSIWCSKHTPSQYKTSAKSDTCPKCKSHMSDVKVYGDTLKAKCDNCGWSGSKKKTAGFGPEGDAGIQRLKESDDVEALLTVLRQNKNMRIRMAHDDPSRPLLDAQDAAVMDRLVELRGPGWALDQGLDHLWGSKTSAYESDMRAEDVTVRKVRNPNMTINSDILSPGWETVSEAWEILTAAGVGASFASPSGYYVVRARAGMTVIDGHEGKMQTSWHAGISPLDLARLVLVDDYARQMDERAGRTSAVQALLRFEGDLTSAHRQRIAENQNDYNQGYHDGYYDGARGGNKGFDLQNKSGTSEDYASGYYNGFDAAVYSEDNILPVLGAQQLEYECTRCHQKEYRTDPAGSCSNCGAPSSQHRIVGMSAVSALLSEGAAEEDWLEVEGAFFHHPQPPNPPGPHRGRTAPHTTEQDASTHLRQQRATDRTERTEQRDTDARHEEYWRQHPQEHEQHLRQNAARVTAANVREELERFQGQPVTVDYDMSYGATGSRPATVSGTVTGLLLEEPHPGLMLTREGQERPDWIPLARIRRVNGVVVTATRKTADAFQEAVRKGMMMGTSEFINPGAMLPSSVYVVMEPGPNGARPTDRKTTSREVANEWAKELLARTDWSPYTARRTADFGGADWDIFGTRVDEEGQFVYTITDKNGQEHVLDEDDAGHLLDSLNGHSAPTELSDLIEEGRTARRRRAVNENAYGTERYQAQPDLTGTHWPDAWEEGKAPQETLDQGRAAHEPDHPFADRLTTVRQSALRHLAVDLEGFEQSDAFDDLSGGTDPQTTRPRVMPHQHRDPSMSNPMVTEPAEPVGAGGGVDMMPESHGFEMGVDPTVPTVDQMVAAKIARLAKRIRVDNPTMAPDQAKTLAARTVARYPEMVRG
jgi:Zn finger protein HypA/HybF involved in hydrogenase expression